MERPQTKTSTTQSGRAVGSLSSGRRIVNVALIGVAAIGLSACATPFKADVSRFNAELPAPKGQSFAVVAEDPKLAGGLEFAIYADDVADELKELGFVRAAGPETADMLVRFDYGVDNGRERVRTNGAGVGAGAFGPWGRFGGFGFRNAYAFGFYDPWLAGPNVRSYTVYTGEIDVKIDNVATGERLFEGRAESASRTNRLQAIVPNLVDALFTDFPGNSGETLRITIKDSGKTVRNKD